MFAMTAAHKKLPFNTCVYVRHPKTQRAVVVRINDRGPYVGEREIDLSYAAAKFLKMSREGVARVEVKVLGKRKDCVADFASHFNPQFGFGGVVVAEIPSVGAEGVSERLTTD
jgi:rare lipoprotein A